MADRVRLDKWLWAARFYKTRSRSADAIKAGKIDVDGARAKPSLAIAVGAKISVRKGPFAFDVAVAGLAERRGPVEAAQALYDETPASVQRREELRLRLAAEHRASPAHWNAQGRPTKKQRRALDAFKQDVYASYGPIDDLDDDKFDELAGAFDDAPDDPSA